MSEDSTETETNRLSGTGKVGRRKNGRIEQGRGHDKVLWVILAKPGKDGRRLDKRDRESLRMAGRSV